MFAELWTVQIGFLHIQDIGHDLDKMKWNTNRDSIAIGGTWRHNKVHLANVLEVSYSHNISRMFQFLIINSQLLFQARLKNASMLGLFSWKYAFRGKHPPNKAVCWNGYQMQSPKHNPKQCECQVQRYNKKQLSWKESLAFFKPLNGLARPMSMQLTCLVWVITQRYFCVFATRTRAVLPWLCSVVYDQQQPAALFCVSLCAVSH